MTIGDRIRIRREQIGMTQEELASALGYKSKSSINKIELGKQELTQKKIALVAAALHTTISYIMGWEDAQAELSSAGLSLQDIAYELGISPEAVRAITESDDPEAVSTVAKVARLIAKEYSRPAPPVQFGLSDLKFAFWGDAEEMSDEDVEDVLKYAEFVRQKKQAK